MKTFVNLTPHEIKCNDGKAYPVSGTAARVSTSYTGFDEDGIAEVVFGEVRGLPEPKDGVVYIVSGLVASAVKGKRTDVVSPATGHPDAVRNEAGQIVSVPGFVR